MIRVLSWLAAVVVVGLLSLVIPQSVLFALAVGLIFGPLIVWAFRGPGVEDDIF